MSFSARETAPSVCCVVVNWNGRADTLRCLGALQDQSYPSLVVVVVDNGSADGSVQAIRERFPAVTVIETGENLGFAGGTNVGLRWAAAHDAAFAWLLNNDTDAPPDTLERLMARAGTDPAIGAVGSVLYRMDQPAAVQAWGGGDIGRQLAYSRHFDAVAVMGPGSYLTFASVLMPMAALRDVGILYEGFFMYFDDADLCLRLRERGYQLLVAEDTAVLHKEGGSSEVKSYAIDRYATTSGLRFLRRHASWPAGSMAVYLALRLLNRLVRGRWLNVKAVLAGTRVFWVERGRHFRETL